MNSTEFADLTPCSPETFADLTSDTAQGAIQTAQNVPLGVLHTLAAVALLGAGTINEVITAQEAAE